MSITGKVPSRFRSYRRGAGFLLARLGAAAERDWHAFLREAGLTHSEFAVLTVCLPEEPMRQSELARRAGMDARNAVPVVAELTGRGLLSSEPDPQDGRAKRIRATPRARALLDGLEAALGSPREQFFAPLTSSEYLTLCELLERLYLANLTEDPHPDRHARSLSGNPATGRPGT